MNSTCYVVRYRETKNVLAAFPFIDAAESYQASCPKDCKEQLEVVEQPATEPVQWVRNF